MRIGILAAVLVVLFILFHAAGARAQAADPDEGDHKRIFGIIPNYRTASPYADDEPLRVSNKFRIAVDDALDRGTFALAALFAGEAQLTAANPSFGSGVSAYGKYFAGSVTDLVVGDFMTEAIVPSLLRQDPRYFRLGEGTRWRRLRYAVGQIVLTHGDSRSMQFNVSEFAGNAAAVGISNAYYRDGRTLSANVSKFGLQIAVDTVANVLKEFAPDLEHAIGHRQPAP